ncbi:DUF2971 domain-containing protein [Vibrio porteresiae]|uniref:DUF2971 domain-containing protein n=1 Tax=Vibrio porteresiae DSM 19223 TaxID=1123496 RepID=A0ABZ0QK98_9VIBR|nr:DUF2971 domain-containing protein [Vibrio porteresiae]WPC76102.1 DUF2971 domain-containing protein [Vibrio porteresiae DSM 19223]
MKLYKYRKFSEFLIRELCASEIYYSDPKQFNDPLDCSPILIDDLPEHKIEDLCVKMLLKNVGKNEADSKIKSFRYYSTQYDSLEEQRKSYFYQLKQEIKSQLDNIMKNLGVLSLSGKCDSPLMWSHYADEHRGICLEFDMDGAVDTPCQIDYEGNRGISTKLIYDYIVNNSHTAHEQIQNQYFYTKAPEWKYESEWRLLSQSYGSHQIPFKLSGIYFGMRCDSWVVGSIIKLLYSSSSNISFYRIKPDQNSFALKDTELEPQEWIHSIPRPSARLAFGKVKVQS